MCVFLFDNLCFCWVYYNKTFKNVVKISYMGVTIGYFMRNAIVHKYKLYCSLLTSPRYSSTFGSYLLSTPPNREALRHSGGERRLCTSATVTLYFDVELRRDRRPGTEQNTSLGFTTPPKRPSLLIGTAETALLLFLDRDTGPAIQLGSS